MSQFEWNEVFMSIEGEAKYSGHPTAYVRFSRCNFKCNGFNNPNKHIDGNGYAPLPFSPSDYKNIGDFSPIEIGCDTQYAVNPEFAHMWHHGSEDVLAQSIVDVLPHQSWINPLSGKRSILSLTGGEPTLHWKKLKTLLNHQLLNDVEIILFETNCAVPFKDQFIDDLNEWIQNGKSNNVNRKVVWSNSPKLSVSGETWGNAIVPRIALKQRCVIACEQYFKFVCGPNSLDFDEVGRAMEAYHLAGIPKDVPVYIMPVACTEKQQQEISAAVADMCIDRGYIYCHRIHNTVYNNAIGK